MTTPATAKRLPENPFLALRAVYGMLLGQDDFETLAANPRGKQMLHAAWLHGWGVVWGFDVRVEGGTTLRVSPGLAVDGRGRDLHTEADWCADEDVRVLVTEQPDDQGVVNAHLIVEFDSCLTSVVPTLANPCDVTRQHDDYSRVYETARFVLRPGPPPAPPPAPYPRVRALLGLHHLGKSTPEGQEVLDATAAAQTAPPDRRAAVLWERFRVLAAADVAERGPQAPTGSSCPAPFPRPEAGAGVLLATVRIQVTRSEGCREPGPIEVDSSVRPALLPTSTITELLCGWAPGILGSHTGRDAGGPRVIPSSLAWRDDRRIVVFDLTHPIQRGSLRHAVSVSSLGPRGWVRQDLAAVSTENDDRRVVVELAEARDYERYRVIVRGTGETPAYGVDPAVPLAGVEGGPPGSADDGHDAVLSRPQPGSGS